MIKNAVSQNPMKENQNACRLVYKFMLCVWLFGKVAIGLLDPCSIMLINSTVIYLLATWQVV